MTEATDATLVANDTTRTTAISGLATTEAERLKAQKFNDERYLGKTVDANIKNANAHAEIAVSADAMQEAMALIAKNIDPMKADQRDMAIISAAVFATCGDFITSVTKDEQIKAIAAKTLMLTDLVFTGIQARLKV